MVCEIGKEKYDDLLDYRLKQLEKSRKPVREASSFYIVLSKRDREERRYSSFDSIPLAIRSDEKNYEILKIRYEHLDHRTQKTRMFAPRIVQRQGYSYYEKLLYNLLTKRGYKENEDFTHLYPIEGQDYVLDFAFVKEMLDIECDGEPWHERCRKKQEESKRDEYLRTHGWKILRFTFKAKELRKNLLNAIKQIDSEIRNLRS